MVLKFAIESRNWLSLCQIGFGVGEGVGALVGFGVGADVGGGVGSPVG